LRKENKKIDIDNLSFGDIYNKLFEEFEEPKRRNLDKTFRNNRDLSNNYQQKINQKQQIQRPH